METIRLKIEYWQGDTLMSEGNGGVDVTGKTLSEITKLSSQLFQKGMSDVITEVLTK